MTKKHLLILGAGASMSLVSENFENKESDSSDKNKDSRLPSGYELVSYIANYNKVVLVWLVSTDIELKDEKKIETLKKVLIENNFLSIEALEKDDCFRKVIDVRRIEMTNIKQLCQNILFERVDNCKTLLNMIQGTVKNKNRDYLEIVKLLFVSHLVRKYMPVSIDYFANNLEFFAATDIKEYINQNFADDADKAKSELHKYLKAIICEYLAERQFKTIEFALSNTDQNYIRQIIWSLSLEANRCGERVKEYIEKSLDIITFNYDTTADILFKHYQDLKVNSLSCAFMDSENDFKDDEINILHVYSYLGAKDDSAKDDSAKDDSAKDDSAKDDSAKDDSAKDDITITPEKFNLIMVLNPHTGKDIAEFEKHLNICDNSILWIRNTTKTKGSKKDEKEITPSKSVCQNLIKNAQNIYFLGFGFDKNNLDSIGITNMKTEYALKNKKYFIAKASSKLIEVFMEQIVTNSCKRYMKGGGSLSKTINDSYGIMPRYGDQLVYSGEYSYESNRLLFSMKDINKAFAEDFDI